MKAVLNKIKNTNSYLYLLIKVAAFLLLAFVFDFLLGAVFRHFYFRQSSGWEYSTKYSVEDTRADILIFGASRAQQQYNPLFFEERLKQTTYNAGRDGEPIFYHYGVLKGVLKRYTPKVIILDVENGIFKQAESSYDRLSVLLPFYYEHPEMRRVIEMRGPFEKLKLTSQIYPYNSMLFKIAIGNTAFNKKRKEDINGYLPLNNTLNEPIRTVDFTKPYLIDSNKLNVYRSFINDCLQANVKLYIVCSPYFINAVGIDSSMKIAKTIAAESKIDVIDFSKNQTFLSNSKLFDDTVHVNTTGAKLFTNQLIDSIIAREQKNL